MNGWWKWQYWSQHDTIDSILLILFCVVICFIYLSSADNLSWLLAWDWLIQSMYIEQIDQTWTIAYGDPYRRFEWEKIQWVLAPYPIHYTQIYHVAAALFNQSVWVGAFSFRFSLVMSLCVVLFSRLWFRQVASRPLSILLWCVVFVVLSSRILYINFIEGYLLLFFFASLRSRYKYMKTKHVSFAILAVVFLAIFAWVKHLGLFDAVLLLTLLLIYFVSIWRLRLSLLSWIIFWVITVSLYYPVWHAIGTIWYGVWTFDVPSRVPLRTQLMSLVSSDYQMRPDREWNKLDYQQQKTLGQYLDGITNYFEQFGGIVRSDEVRINYLFVVLFLLWGIVSFRKRPLHALVWLLLMARELMLLYGLQQNFNQYIHLVTIWAALFVFSWLNRSSRHGLPRSASSIIIVCVLCYMLLGFFQWPWTRQYQQEWRRYLENERLYERMALYLSTSPSEFEDALFVASDPYFAHLAQVEYVWYPELRHERTSDMYTKIEDVQSYYGADYLIVNDLNTKQRWFYDYIPQWRVEHLVRNNFISLEQEFTEWDHRIRLYRLQ